MRVLLQIDLDILKDSDLEISHALRSVLDDLSEKLTQRELKCNKGLHYLEFSDFPTELGKNYGTLTISNDKLDIVD